MNASDLKRLKLPCILAGVCVMTNLHLQAAPPPNSAHATYLTNLHWTAIKNGWGPVEKNQSNGENKLNDGHTLTLHKKKYPFGFGCHAPSEIRVDLDGHYQTFMADIGFDDEVKARGSAAFKARVIFKAFADKRQIFDSGVITAASPIKTIRAPLRGAKQLRLVVVAGNGHTSHPSWSDSVDAHVDWAGTRVLK